MSNFQTRMDQYNESLIQLLWNHKAKFIVFTLFTIIGYTSIPYLKDTQRQLKEKSKHGKHYLNLEDIEKRTNMFDIILDVRSKEEYEKGHVKNSINIDFKDILENGNSILNKKGIDKDKTILVYCKSGRRASIVVNHLLDELVYDSRNIYLTSESHEKLNNIFK